MGSSIPILHTRSQINIRLHRQTGSYTCYREFHEIIMDLPEESGQAKNGMVVKSKAYHRDTQRNF